MSKLRTCQLDNQFGFGVPIPMAKRVYQYFWILQIYLTKLLPNFNLLMLMRIFTSSRTWKLGFLCQFIHLYAGQHLHRLHPEKKKCSHYKRGPINMETIMIMMMIGTRDTVHGTGEHDRNSSVAIKPG